MADVFISYNSKDRAAAARVEQVLSRRGIDVFWDQETPPGQDWDTWTRAKLAEATIVVVLWSKTSVASDSVRHEAMLARKDGKLLPAMIDNVTPEDLPMGLYMVQSVILTDWNAADSKGMGRLVAEIEARMRGTTTAPPAQPRRARMTRVDRPAPPARRSGAMPLLIGIAVLAIAGVAGWILTQPNQPEGATGEPGLTTAAAATAAPAATSGMFSQRMLGHWNWDGLACKDGPNITMEGGKLVFTTPDSRFVHVIEKDEALKTITRVIEPDYVLGEQYELVPEFNATDEVRSFNLLVKNLTTKKEPNTWSPCEP